MPNALSFRIVLLQSAKQVGPVVIDLILQLCEVGVGPIGIAADTPLNAIVIAV